MDPNQRALRAGGRIASRARGGAKMVVATLASVVGLAWASQAMGQFERTLGINVPSEHFSLTRTTGPDGFLSGGYQVLPTDNQRKLHLVRWSPTGVVMWERIGLIPGRTEVHSVAPSATGDFLVAGETNAVAGGPLGIFLMRIDPAGNTIWARVITGTPFVDARRVVTVIEAKDGTILVTGRESNPAAGGQWGRIARFSPAGAPIWNFRYNDTISPTVGQVTFTDLRESPDGFWVVGDRRTGAVLFRQMTLFHIAPNGGPIIAFLYNLPDFDTTGDSIDRREPNGEMLLGGVRQNAAGGPAMLKMVMVNAGGVPVWNQLYNYGNLGFQLGHTAALFVPPAAGSIQVAGRATAGLLNRSAWQRFTPAGVWASGHMFGVPAETAFDDLDLRGTVEPAMVGFYENGPFAFGARAVYLARADGAGDTGCKGPDLKPTPINETFFSQTNYVPSASTLALFDPKLTKTESKHDYPCPPCYADCDLDGVLSIADFICFQTAFAVSDPYADCDGDSVLSISDFICFQTFFALGC